ncbi:MAG: protein translocase subunit SecF, partial [Lentisphaerae bacterium]|nr:protein translocase subunit SecF [Lentisphaerota bacterium]
RVGANYSETVSDVVRESFSASGFEVIAEETLGPQIGREMSWRALKALIFALIGMVIYISIRFEFAFAVGAMLALVHDVMVCVGLYVLIGGQINMTVVAALLAIIGYSINDTIVVFDRIRENLRRKSASGFLEVCNKSINETLSRTFLTSFTSLLAVLMLLIFGGGAIRDFSIIFFLGILVGTYSSVIIATPVMIGIRQAISCKGSKKKN